MRAIYAIALIATATADALADTVKLAGSATVVNAVVNPSRQNVEKASGHTLQIVNNSTGKGLVDLTERNADIAMISSQLETALATAEVAGKKDRFIHIACARTARRRNRVSRQLIQSGQQVDLGATRRYPHRKVQQLETGRRQGSADHDLHIDADRLNQCDGEEGRDEGS
jgi:hypothetical protein